MYPKVAVWLLLWAWVSSAHVFCHRGGRESSLLMQYWYMRMDNQEQVGALDKK